jgi:hypothetical protein
MKKFYLLILFICVFSVSFSQSIVSQLEKLSKEYNFTFEKLEKGDKFTERYLLWVTQDLDHKNLDGKTFKQRVFISHKDINNPVVLVTEGYWSTYAENPNYSNEITDILNANQIVVEHRYFSPSVPDSSVFDWKYLTIENAAGDHHRVVEILKHIYHKKWLNTGISKGGQTAMYHKYFYPNDVDVSVPVVAPLNFSKEEQRVYRFFNTVGTPECRKKIKDFQIEMLKNKSKYFDLFAKIANEKSQTYNRVGGTEKGYELTVLEFSFAFWQWGNSCEKIPTNNEPDRMVRALIGVAGLDWVSDQGIEYQQPFFYQAMREFGMYGYNIESFKEGVSFDKNPTFEFTFPKGVNVIYNPETHRKIDCFVRHKAKNMIFIVGGNDPWGSPSVNLTYETNSIKIIKEGGCHKTRIMNLPKEQKDFVIKTIIDWLK